MMNHVSLRLALLLSPLVASGQSSGAFLTAPTLDYLFDEGSSRILPVKGIPGAAYLDEALPFDIAAAKVSPNRRYALAADPQSGSTLLLLLGDELKAVPLAGMPVMPRAAFSPSGETVALFDPDSGHVETWRGLPAEAAKLATFDTGNSLRAVAVSDDGGALVVLSADGTLQLLSSDTPQLLGVGFSAFAFFANTHDLLGLDGDGNLVRINKVTGDATTDVLVSGVGAGIAVTASNDGSRLLLITRDEPSVALFDLGGNPLARLKLSQDADGLYPSRGSAVFRLSSRPAEGLLYFDGDSQIPRLVTTAVIKGDQ